MNIAIKTMNKAHTVREQARMRAKEMKGTGTTQSGIEMRERQTHSLFKWSQTHSGIAKQPQR